MKQTIRLTENELHNLIKESVNNILSELDWRTARAASNAASKKLNNSDDKYERDRRFYQITKFDEYANKRYNTQYGFPEDLKDDWEERNNVAYEMKNNSKDWEYNPETNKARPLNDKGKPISYKWWQNVPQEFHPTQGQLKKLSQRDKDIKDFNNGNSEYRSGKWRQKDVIEPDESDYLDRLAQRHKHKKQPSQIHKRWQDVLDYDFNTNSINL